MSTASTLPELVVGDVLAAAADDLGVPLSSRDVRRLAPHVVELLALAGYSLESTHRSNR